MMMASLSTESVSAVDIAAVHRLGRVDVAAGGATGLSLAFGEENPFAERAVKEAHQIALAARWIDALPFKVDARDGGVLFALRVRGP
jgi:hypothetical protein